ncbi:lipopolysaccharide biosynthesis protein [Lysobacteraceae bacterium NML71-0210]|nr:lipopolysaccharide biosynthesis protein [Xanthomonadaceae bacterium NML71-0210]
MSQLPAVGRGQAIAQLRIGMNGFWLWFAGAALASLLGTGLARRYALHRQLLDMPGDTRRNHQHITPRGGGIAMALLMWLACLGLAMTTGQWGWLLLATGLAAVAGVGWWDDHRPLSVRLRFAVHLAAAGLLALAGIGFGWPLWLCLCGFIAALALTNIWNFIDGINGIAASQALLVALLAVWLMTGAGQIFALLLLAVCAGFLPWNFPRARIFMGDVGSGALGYLLAVVWTLSAAAELRFGWLLALPLSTCVLDATLTLLLRIRRGEKWWQAHSAHSYQIWARRLGRHTSVTLAYALWSLLAVLLGTVFLHETSLAFLALACILWFTAGAIGWLCLRKPTSHRNQT